MGVVISHRNDVAEWRCTRAGIEVAYRANMGVLFGCITSVEDGYE